MDHIRWTDKVLGYMPYNVVLFGLGFIGMLLLMAVLIAYAWLERTDGPDLDAR